TKDTSGTCDSPPRLHFAELPEGVKNSYPVGTKLQYSCRPGYILSSGKSRFVTCLENSKWSVEAEFCEEPTLNTTPNGPKESPGLNTGTMIAIGSIVVSPLRRRLRPATLPAAAAAAMVSGPRCPPGLWGLLALLLPLPGARVDDPTLSQILGDRPVLAYRQPPNLKRILTSNHIPHNRTTNPGAHPCNKARCQLCPHIYSGDTITGPNHVSHTIKGSFTCTSTNVIYAIMCQQCPSAMYIGQTGQSLRKRIKGHKSDVKNYNIHKPVGEHFSLSGHMITDMKVAILQQKNFKTRLQRETVELEFICKLDTINLGLNRDWEWLSHYAS
ncbi:unnamed protein product, partial [Eretmochelys imbricata]